MTDRPRKGQTFSSPAFQGRWPLTAGEYYSSGKWHGAWDVGCPIGTPVTAPVDATVGDLNDGVRNQPVGVPGGPGSPANWVLLHYRSPRYGPVTLWFQHLNRGVPVRKGQQVKAGQVVGYSGNSGNTYGPHLHLQAMRGYRRGTGRWVIYSDRSQNIFHPSASWAGMTTTPPEEDDLTKEEHDMLRHVYMTLTPGIRGRKHHGDAYNKLLHIWNTTTPGIRGQKHDGVVYRAIRQIKAKVRA